MKIYMLIKDNNPIYIGSTSRKYLCERAREHRLGSGCYKKDFDSYELIEYTDNIDREEYWISYYDTFNNGLNKTPDGKCGVKKGNINIWKNRSVIIYNDNGFIKIYNSIKEASHELNLDSSSISHVCRGKQKTHKGFKASYAESEMI